MALCQRNENRKTSDQMDLVSKEGVCFGLMSPLRIGVAVVAETLAFPFAGTDFDAELAGVSPDVGGIDGGMHLLLDESCCDGLGTQLMEDVVEELLSQTSAKPGEDSMEGVSRKSKPQRT